MAVNPNRSLLDQQQILQRAFDEANDKLRVDSSVSVTSITGDVVVDIDAATGDNIAIANADGSKKVTVSTFSGKEGLDVNIINASEILNNLPPITNTYNEITSLPASTLTTIVSTTATGNSRLILGEVSGTNIAEFTIEVNSVVIAKARTYFGSSLNHNFDFKAGITLVNGDVVRARVIHNRPDLGDFNARLEIQG